MRLARFVGCSAAALLSTVSVTPAQQAARSVCFRGRPLPKCRGFSIVELTLNKDVASSYSPADNSSVPFGFNTVGIELGAMINRDSTHAIGATLGAATATRGGRVWVAARRRTWAMSDAVPPGSYRDFSAGLVATREYVDPRPGRGATAYGLGAEVTGGYRDLVGVSVGGDLLLAGSKPVASLRFGVRTGSWVALGALVVGVLVAGASAGGG